MRMNVKEVIELLEKNGWHYVGSRGDHHKYKKEGAEFLIVVPGNDKKDIPIGTLKKILRQAGLN